MLYYDRIHLGEGTDPVKNSIIKNVWFVGDGITIIGFNFKVFFAMAITI